MNPSSFKSLPASLQGVLVEACRSADAIGAKWAKEKRDAEHAEMGKHGVEIVSLPNSEVKSFINLTEEKLWSKIIELDSKEGTRLKTLFEKAG